VPNPHPLNTFLARASRRVAWIAAAQGAAAGLVIALVMAIAGWPGRNTLVLSVGVGVGLAAAGAIAREFMRRRRAPRVALAVERRAPQCRNHLVTADELLLQGVGASGHGAGAEYVRSLVLRQADRLAGGLDIGALFPARGALAMLGVSLFVWSLALVRANAPHGGSAFSSSAPGASASIQSIDVVITPPAYTGRSAQTFRDPARIEALTGSRVQLRVRADAASLIVETLHGRAAVAASADQSFTSVVPADADGYIALEPAVADGHAGPRRLIGVSVIPDNAPRVRITTPGKDLFLRDGHRTIELAIEASDDIGLASLRLRYTRVSGSGERFTFTEGEVPIEVVRTDARTWTARAQWRLDSLALAPGDMVVYRAVAADHRPGAIPSESDSFIAEVLAPGGEAAAGFALDPDEQRYAVSQQMVIVKTERLAPLRATMTPEAFASAAQDIAAEQRKVRAEFVFMMGGEIADAADLAASMTDIDEQADVAGEEDLAAGRMANQGRIALLRSIRSMSRASGALTTPDLTLALTHERAALAELERAFSHSRIILRALTERERLDPSRRLTGSLADAARDVHPGVDPQVNPRVAAMRSALAGIAGLAGAPRLDAAASARASGLAEGVLQIDPSAKSLQDVAAQLSAAGGALSRSRADDARSGLDRAATALAAALRAALPDAPRTVPGLDANRLNGALTDALRHPLRGAP
jgi:hypothetical protein